MPWFVAIGTVVCSAVGVAVTSSIALAAIGGAVVGAAVGGLYAAFTGGNIVKGMLWGAVGGAVIGGGGYALGGAMGAWSTGGAGGAAAAGGSAISSTTVVPNTVGGGYTVMGNAVGQSAGQSLFTASALPQYATTAASLGSAFMKGDADQSNMDKQLAWDREKYYAGLEQQSKQSSEGIAAQLEAAQMQADVARERIKTEDERAKAELAFSKEKFSKEFGESVFRDRADREERERAKREQTMGVATAASSIVGTTETISPVEANRRRQQIQKPNWYLGPQAPPAAQGGTQVAAVSGPQGQAGVVAQGATPPPTSGTPSPLPQQQGLVGAA